MTNIFHNKSPKIEKYYCTKRVFTIWNGYNFGIVHKFYAAFIYSGFNTIAFNFPLKVNPTSFKVVYLFNESCTLRLCWSHNDYSNFRI